MAATMKLAEVIRGLRQEVAEAVKQADGEPILFALDRVEIELQVTIESQSEEKGGINIGVLNLGAGSSDTEIESHSIRLILDVRHVDESGKRRRVQVSDD